MAKEVTIAIHVQADESLPQAEIPTIDSLSTSPGLHWLDKPLYSGQVLMPFPCPPSSPSPPAVFKYPFDGETSSVMSFNLGQDPDAHTVELGLDSSGGPVANVVSDGNSKYKIVATPRSENSVVLHYQS